MPDDDLVQQQDVKLTSNRFMQIDGKQTTFNSETVIPAELLNAMKSGNSNITINPEFAQPVPLEMTIPADKQGIPMQITEDSAIKLVGQDLSMTVSGKLLDTVNVAAPKPLTVEGAFKLLEDDKGTINSFVTAVSTIQQSIETFKTAVSYDASQNSAGLNLAIADIKDMGSQINNIAQELVDKIKSIKDINDLYNSRILDISDATNDIEHIFRESNVSFQSMSNKINDASDALIQSNKALGDKIAAVKQDLTAISVDQTARDAIMNINIQNLTDHISDLKQVQHTAIIEQNNLRVEEIQNSCKRFDTLFKYLKIFFFTSMSMLLIWMILKIIGVL